MLKIDKSKMSPEERAAYDEIVKKYGFEEETVEKSSTVKPGENDDGEEDLDDGKNGKKTNNEEIGSIRSGRRYLQGSASSS